MDRPFSERKFSDPAIVQGFGTHLKYERQNRGFTLEDVSETTKIRVSYLEALEKEDMARLPAETFTKGFIRSYCRCIRIDDQDVIRDYSRRVGHDESTRMEKAPPAPDKKSRFMGSIRRILTGVD